MSNEQKSTFERIQNRIYTAVLPVFHEKQFTAENGQTLRYMFFPGKSNTLVVVFQACSDAGARYNYVRTLSDCGVNRLFIKDDFGPGGYGDYYLGCDGTYSVETAVLELIRRYVGKLHPEKLVFAGSSKGGYAALDFGLRFPDSVMIVAAPQYFLGSYLYGEGGNGRWVATLDEILGKSAETEDIQKLDFRLQKIIREDKYASTQRVYIHYSAREHTYAEHIQYLLKDLAEDGISTEKDVGVYKEHGDLKYYFPQYIKHCLRVVTEEKR